MKTYNKEDKIIILIKYIYFSIKLFHVIYDMKVDFRLIKRIYFSIKLFHAIYHIKNWILGESKK